ncbi:MAG TPA: hypothetical protein PLA94_07970 [Myxococcota bacterium]|nr:hypothetical protein [Myxococcota bacterium]
MIPLLLALACSGSGTENCTTPEDFKKLTRVTLPGSVESFRCYSEQGIDTAALARFVLPASEMDSFYQGLGLGVPLKTGQNPLRPETAWPPEWWRATSSGAYRGAEGQVGNRAFKLRVEESANSNVEVFLLSFTL